MSHTKEKLVADGDWIGLESDSDVAVAYIDGSDDFEINEANARRLVACWNYCNGVPTDELEKMEPNDDGLRGVYATKTHIEKERDELLAALRRQFEADDTLYAIEFDCDKEKHEAAMKEHYKSYKNIASILNKYKEEE